MSRRSAAPPPHGRALPALVLRCRLAWRFACALASIFLLGAGAGVLARATDPAAPPRPDDWTAPFLLIAGAACAYFTTRYCLAVLVLDDQGFRLSGPLVDHAVAWSALVAWARVPPKGGGAVVRVVHGPDRRRLTIPLIYEESHLLEVGLAQRGFPRF